jgi:hypothetical protein
MPWFEYTIECWEQFETIVQAVRPPAAERTFYRGQAVSTWGLTPTLARTIPLGSMTVAEIEQLELAAIEKFRQDAHDIMKDNADYVLNPPTTPVDWLALMQQYRVPTRLLDWTFSPYVAAYFAVASFEHSETEGAIWFFDEDFVDAYLNANAYVQASAQGTKALSPDLMNYQSITTVYQNPRIKSQQGLFTWYRDICKNFDEVVDGFLISMMLPSEQLYNKSIYNHALFINPAEEYGKLIIPATAKTSILRGLSDEKNISARTIYTGLEGLGQSVVEFMRLRLVAQPGHPLPPP